MAAPASEDGSAAIEELYRFGERLNESKDKSKIRGQANVTAPLLDFHHRPDGRSSALQLRPLHCSRGLLSRAHGSATWSQENTTVMAAVYGPRPVMGRKENAERAVVEVLWKAKGGLPGSFEKDAEVVVRRSLEYVILAALHPNTGISVILQVISDDGSLLACATNAACAALVDAGVPLSGLLTAVSCGVTHEGQVFLDPTKQEEQKSKAYVCLVFPSRPLSAVPDLPADVDGEPVEYGIVTSVTRGAMEVEEYFTCVENGRAASLRIAEFSRTSYGTELSQSMSPALVNDSWFDEGMCTRFDINAYAICLQVPSLEVKLLRKKVEFNKLLEGKLLLAEGRKVAM